MNRVVRALLIAVAVVAVVVLLFTVVFPWFDATFVNDPVMGTMGGSVLELVALAG